MIEADQRLSGEDVSLICFWGAASPTRGRRYPEIGSEPVGVPVIEKEVVVLRGQISPVDTREEL